VDGERSRAEETVLRLREESQARVARARALRIARLCALAALFSASALGLERWRQVSEVSAAPRVAAPLSHDARCAEHETKWKARRVGAAAQLAQAMMDGDEVAMARVRRERAADANAAAAVARRDGCAFEVPERIYEVEEGPPRGELDLEPPRYPKWVYGNFF
jgi:hypothetical protein